MNFQSSVQLIFTAVFCISLPFSAHSALNCGAEINGTLDIEEAVAAIAVHKSEEGPASYDLFHKLILVPPYLRDQYPSWEFVRVHIYLFSDDSETYETSTGRDRPLTREERLQSPMKFIQIDVIDTDSNEVIDNLEFLEKFLSLRKVKDIVKDSVDSPVAMVPSFVVRPVIARPQFAEFESSSIEIDTTNLQPAHILAFVEAFEDYLVNRNKRIRELIRSSQ
jgi:hypothetical protein